MFRRLTVAAVAAAACVGAQPAFVKLPAPNAMPVPTPQQLKYQGGISALIHFNMATFFHDGDPGCTRQNWNGCDPNGGCNSSNVASFAPTNLNVSNWVESMLALGATSGVLTAKHGCGFLGWQTNTTLPDGSPYGYNVPTPELAFVPLFAEAMSAAGLGYGYYYSLTNNFHLNVLGHNVQPPSTLLPGQANVTQAQFEQLALDQMRELWTAFGNLTEIWMDGGCGDMCDKAAALLAQTPAINAVVFNGGLVSPSPVRWCGTEGGEPDGYPTVWSTASCGWCPDGSGSGSPPNTTGAFWYPSGVDVTLQQGDHWFWTPGDAIHPLTDLIDFYHHSVGANAHLEIDFAIDRTGNVDPTHAAAYAQFGAWIRACYGTPIASGAMAKGATSVTVALPGSSFDRVSMQEDQSTGQLIVTYVVEYLPPTGGNWVPFSMGTTVGSNRIDISSGGAVTATQVRFSVTSGFAVPAGLTLKVFSGAGCAAS